MKLADKNSIIKWANSVSDTELEKEYYDTVYNSLGSQTTEMYDLGYDKQDIRERETFEKFLCQKSDLLATICVERGISIW